MIHTKPDFFNTVSADIRAKFFADVKTWEDSKTSDKAIYIIELFNNSCLTYRAFIGRLAKACRSNNATIHNIVEKYILSFGDYRYKPNKLYSQSKVTTDLKLFILFGETAENDFFDNQEITTDVIDGCKVKEFATIAEKKAYLQGLQDMTGFLAYNCLTAEEFKKIQEAE